MHTQCMPEYKHLFYRTWNVWLCLKHKMAINQDRAMAMVNQIDLRTYYYYILLSSPRPPSSSLQYSAMHNVAKMLTHPLQPKYYPWKVRAYLNLLNLLFHEKIYTLFCFWKVQKISYEIVVSRTSLNCLNYLCYATLSF